MNRTAAKELYLLMTAAWPHAGNHSPETTRLWVDFLSDFSEQDGEAAFRELVPGYEFFPSFARFTEAANLRRAQRVIAARQKSPKQLDGPKSVPPWRKTGQSPAEWAGLRKTARAGTTQREPPPVSARIPDRFLRFH